MPQQSKFLKTALNLMKENPAGFEALEEFEKTGKTLTKTRLNFTIDRVLAKEFRNYCKKNNVNMSNKIEILIKNYLKNK